MKSTVLYIGKFGKSESASLTRVKNLANLIIDEQISAVICSYDGGVILEVSQECKMIECAVPEYNTIGNILEILSGKHSFEFVRKCIEKYKPKNIILYNATFGITKKVLKYAKKSGINIFCDVTEWYEIPSIKQTAMYIYARSVDRRIRKLDRKMDGVIAISNYLYKYYSDIGVKTLKIPPIMDIKDEQFDYKLPYQPLRLIYAGSPGAKDLLIPVFEALSIINDKDIVIRFDLFGVSEEYVKKIWNCHELKAVGIFCHGRVVHSQVVYEVKNAHYTVLFRKRQRYALAGYSTKVCESMFLGTPVICNKIGGTDSDIQNGVTGIVLESAVTSDIVDALKWLQTIPELDYMDMRKQAKEYAKENYSGKTYVKQLKRFLGYD
ncbi:glycosyltransferase [Eubacterium sp.]|uniref:glycosyltransferase n=1 Tax=Eubacterium sp. TaxID=142586 RepID=UPI002585429A|nr:glycosyltransferase [Eubacterium sp.]MCR5368473.1 glycosyltransferase [Eubacterium sp.]